MATTMQRALRGVRVVELGDFVSAPWAARLLADLGAEVVKVEPPRVGDSSRRAGPFPGDTTDPETSGLFLYVNAGKRGVTLDVTVPEGRAAVEELVATADVVVENLPTSVVDAHGLDGETLRAANPAAVVVSVSPFGRTGPRRNWLGGELIAFHTSGVGHETPGFGLHDLDTQQPLKAPGYQASFSAGWLAALAAMTALYQRDVTGRGQLVDVSEQEAMATHVRQNITRLSYDGEVDHRHVTPAGSDAMAFGRCKDGLFSGPSLGYTERDWARLRALLGHPDWSDDPSLATPDGRLAQRDMVHRKVAEWKLERTRAELFDLVQEAGVVGFPLNTIADTFSSAQLRERAVFQTVGQGAESVLLPRPPWIAHDGAPQLLGPAPRLGEHNDEVLGTDRCVELRAAGAM